MKRLIDTSGLTGRVVTSEDESYKESCIMWNRAIEKEPLVIVYCKTREDVKNSVIWAREHQVPIRVRSGGHHYAGYSTGDDVLVIDVSEMNSIQLDEVKQQVTIEGGVKNREIYECLGSKGYSFPGGGCPSVGVVGLALGGGWGYSCRLLGLACDAITQVELINAEGQLIRANEEEHPDLFWALKGSGGGQFGVVVGMTFKVAEKRSEATLIRLDFSDVTREEQIQMFNLWQDTLQDLCPEANFKLSFYNSQTKGTGILLIGMYYGSHVEAHELIAPFIKIGRKVQIRVEPMTVLEVNRWIQDAHPDFEHYKSSGRFVEKKFDEEEMHQLLECIKQPAEGAVYTAVSCYGMGGQVKRPDRDSTAFYYRDSLYILGFQTVWEDNTYSESNREWFIKPFERIKKLTVGSFVNFPAMELEDYRQAYYGGYSEQLIAIRKKYDPQGVFAFEQGI